MVEVWLLIGMLYGGDGKIEGVRVLHEFANPQQCIERAKEYAGKATAEQKPLSFSCVPYTPSSITNGG